MTAAITVNYSDIGSGNAENLSDLTEQDLPEGLMLTEAYVDTFKVQCCNNIDHVIKEFYNLRRYHLK
jgi:hypothetical protein